MEKSKLHGIEIDPLSGRIAKQLYQRASIAIEGFEDTKLPDDHFDVVLGNVPFGEFKVNDNRYNSQKFLIHDYFFAKALDKARAGGVVMFITSKGTMDKASPEVRKYIAQRAELLGAIRLPDNTFKANAGTEVTSDILILQKREQIIDTEPEWVHLDTDENGITMNRYFVTHPEMVLGEMKMESTRFGMDSACKAYEDVTLAELLSEAVQQISGEIPEYENEIDQISDEQDEPIPADPNVRNFSFALVDGKIYFRENNQMTPAKVSMTAENRIRGLVEIRDCVRRLIQYQTDDYPEEMIQTEQKNLNRLYDAYTAKYGLINSRGNYLAFASDESYFLLCSLEVLDDDGKFKRKADMFTKRTIKPHREVTFVETASEALALSIGEKARVDLDYMAQLVGRPQEEIVKDLRGVIFKVPLSEPAKYVTADEYLSGNVRAKLITAKAAAQDNPEYAVNVSALERVIPKDLPASEISVRLGTTWIHNLDCPWRPSDLEQRQGRIERQGNMFPEVQVYRYVTEQTFDAYLYQLVESKQKFISQIMTSKSPVRSAEDVDEVALSFAEVKMLATGDERFKEKMDLDMQVAKLKVLKQSYLSEHYDLEDRILKDYPQEIKDYEERIIGYGNDAAIAEQHKPQGEDKFCPMTLKGVTYTKKADAGEMLLAICKEYPMSAPAEIGSYRGFKIEVFYDTVNAHYCLNLCGARKYKVDLGMDALGNLTRIENELAKLPARLEAAKTKKAETIAQLETAKVEVEKPFAFEEELKEKTERLNALNIELNLNEKDTPVIDDEPEQDEETPEKKNTDRER